MDVSRDYMDLDDYQEILTAVESKLSHGARELRNKLPIGELIVSDVLLVLKEYMPEEPPEWIEMLFNANSEFNAWLVEECGIDRTILGWMFANKVVDQLKKTGNA